MVTTEEIEKMVATWVALASMVENTSGYPGWALNVLYEGDLAYYQGMVG